jgi:light-regulated signal transduction histidine kinase (bacteriophytochrome)
VDGQALRASVQSVLNQWEIQVRTRSPAARTKSKFALQDHLPIFVETVASALDCHESHVKEGRQQELGEIHGKERASFPDYSLAEVLDEYTVLRKTLKEFLKSTHSDLECYQIVDDLIDRAMVTAASEFTEAREAQLQDVIKKYEATNRDLEQFAAIAAHDLRSPVATISGYVTLLKEEVANQTGMVRQSLDFIASASQRMLILIERLLDYSRIGKTEIKKKPVDLNEVLTNTMANLESLLNETKTQLLYKDLPTVWGDETLLGQLFQNLIANSIKFRSSEPPVIKIALVEETSDHWLLSVTDNGIGFDAAQAESIFQPFKRLHTKQEYQGAGLGLSTCRRVVELHDGRIWAESHPGRGSTFYFTISQQKST